MHDVLAAGLALGSGRADGAVMLLGAAVDDFVRADMAMYAAAARRRLGVLIGADTGRALAAEGGEAMQAQGVRNLDAMTEMLCPGCQPG